MLMMLSLPVFGGLVACGEDDDSSASDGGDTGGDSGGDSGGGAGAACAGSAAVTTYLNPGHAHGTLGLSESEINTANTGLTYQLMDGGHTHSFSLTAQNFTDLQNGLTISLSDTDGHGHNIEVSC